MYEFIHKQQKQPLLDNTSHRKRDKFLLGEIRLQYIYIYVEYEYRAKFDEIWWKIIVALLHVQKHCYKKNQS